MIVVSSYGNEFSVEPIEGRTILTLVNDKVKIPELDGIPFQCQSGTCKRCIVFVKQGHEYLAPPSQTEMRALGPRLGNGFRLACQTKAIQQKKFLRQKMIRKRQELDAEYRAAADKIIIERCMGLSAIQNAKTIMLYSDFRGEVGTRQFVERLLEDGKQVFLPVTDHAAKLLLPVQITGFEQLHPGAYGILEPQIPPEAVINKQDASNVSLDVVVVPGVAFRTDGGRLGYGGGFYDRFLANLPNPVIKIGLAYQFQIDETFPVDDHDVMMDLVVTQKKVYGTK
ncbi:5-formyltetrahydrofolate cyclo-ligase [Fodinisporobacter ferrooxydans]|uniref:5-formyltetrahydrofolate cyclo-ligase n=1 Tax=Fodinisporobacter ferrooxydans TaxID=2901836 RepID=A0ABY4CWC0_9BACL|nr:5-formyltetrahydrofolate cyclo-ligase [Alicyclobacillaceae bacterium MYW30-H2]